MLTEERRQEILDWSNKGQIKFQLWLEEHQPEDNMLWKSSWWDRNVFIREDLFKFFGYDYEIVGSHRSKSIECPVVLVKYKNTEIILQYNFYDWQVMVKSKEAVELNYLDLYHAAGDYFYYQGIPEEGYTKLVENIIGDDIDILLNTDYLENRDKYSKLANYCIYSGPIDKFCNYIYGNLKWRSLRFEIADESDRGNNLYGIPVINLPDKEEQLLRITEHKWFTKERVETSDDFNSYTYVTYEYPLDWTPDKECYYPINDQESEAILDKYIKFTTDNFPTFVFGGRQGTYRPLSMAETIRLALNICNLL